MQPVEQVAVPVLVAVAAWAGAPRLIDNVLVTGAPCAPRKWKTNLL